MIEYSINAFLFRFIYESAGIYYNNIMILPRALMHSINIIGNKLPAQYFTVNHIFAASQRNDINLVFISFRFHK